jgi:voltage-gated potassium channel Kch
MSTQAHQPVKSPRRARRRRAVLVVSRSLLVSTVMVVAYFVLPLTSPLGTDTGFWLVVGLAAVGGLLAWQVRQIVRSALPGVQAVAALAVTIPLFLIVFAATYYLMGYADADNFSEPLTRVDSLYFTITTFATVGFGDITAVSQAARGVAMTQMVLGLVLVGLIAHVIVGAVQVAKRRQRRGRRNGAPRPSEPASEKA